MIIKISSYQTRRIARPTCLFLPNGLSDIVVATISSKWKETTDSNLTAINIYYNYFYVFTILYTSVAVL